MNLPDQESLPTTFNSWMNWFQKRDSFISVPEDIVASLIHHLADLNLFRLEPPDHCFCNLFESDEVSGWESEFSEALQSLSHRQEGFVVDAIWNDPNHPLDLFSLPPNPNNRSKKPDESSRTKPRGNPEKPSSNLSNLQIVKKVGRQLHPFLEAEENFMSWVIGPNTPRNEALTLFNHLLARSREKGQARKWEQVSRRRHK